MTVTVNRSPRVIMEGIAVAAVVVACVAGPLAIGGAPGWARLALDALVALATLAWALSARRSPWLLALPMVALAIGFLQLVPLPDGLLLGIAPVSAGRWKVALDGIPGVSGRIAVDPHAAALSLRQLFFGLGLVAVVADLGRVPRWRRWIAGALAVAAVVILATGLAFPVKKQQGVARLLGIYPLSGPLDFWRSPVVEPVASAAIAYPLQITAAGRRYEVDEWVTGDGFGSYVDTNKFAGGVYLTLPVACGVWLAASVRWLPGAVGAAVRFGVAVAALLGGVWVTGRMAGSRAGTAALAFALLVLVAGAARVPRLRWAAGGLVAGAAVLLLTALLVLHGPLRGLERAVPDRFEPTIAKLLSDGRVEAARVANRMFRAAPLLGTGLGSYRGLFVQLVRDSRVHFAFAHDDVDQWLAETGLVGLAAEIGLCVAIGMAWWRWRKRVAAEDWGVTAGVFAALAGLAVHSFFDWNLHLPANAFLAAVLVGSALSAVPAVAARNGEGREATAGGRSATILAGLLCLATVTGVGLVSRDVGSQRSARQLREALVAVRRAAQAKPPEPLPRETLEAALVAGAAARRLDPGNPTLPLLEGQVLLHLADGADPAAAAGLLERADESFRQARRRSAVCQGLPEPVPPVRPGR